MTKPEPKRHHFVPQFYLRRWAGPDGRVVQFSAPFGNKIKALRKSPAATGYMDDLYKMEIFRGPEAQELESQFLHTVDTEAAEALKLLEDGAKDWKWDAKSRSAWTRFLLSLMIRGPHDIRVLKNHMIDDFHKGATEVQQKIYLQTHKPEDPATRTEYFKQIDPKENEARALKIFAQLHNNKETGQIINDFVWFVIQAKPGGARFLTSDRPVFFVPFERDDALVSMPIGPTKLFVALKNPRHIATLEAHNRDELVRTVNRQTVARALYYVWGADDSSLAFVQAHFGRQREPSIMENMVQRAGGAELLTN